MKIGSWARILLAAAPILACFLTGCGDFWQAPNTSTTTGFSLTASPTTLTVAQGSTGTSAIAVTPGTSFTGSVTLSCAMTGPTGATSSNEPTCSFSVLTAFSSATPQTSTLTLTTTSSTPLGAYQITINGVSGSVATSTSLCVEVGTGTCTSTASTSGNFYVLNQTTNQVVAMNITSGQLTTIGTVTPPVAQPEAIAVAPNGKFLYVSTSGGGIYLYQIGSNGALTLENSGIAISQDQAVAMQVDATNGWLVYGVPGTTQAQLFAIAINSSTGNLASINETKQPSPLLPAPAVKQLAISPDTSSSCAACYVFVAMGDGGTEFINFNPSLVSGNPFGGSGNPGLLNSSGGDIAVAVDPTNQYLYIGETDAIAAPATQSGGLRFFSISASGITPIGVPYATGGTGPTAIQPSLDGKYVYVANGSVSGSTTGNISSFSVASTGLTFIATATAGPSGQIGLAEDSKSSYLLAVDFAGNPDLQAYTMSSGTLTSALTDTTGTDPVGAYAIAAP